MPTSSAWGPTGSRVRDSLRMTVPRAPSPDIPLVPSPLSFQDIWPQASSYTVSSLRTVASIRTLRSSAARSCCDAANLRGLSFTPGSFLQTLCGFEGFRRTRLQRIVVCGSIHNHSVLDWMISPNHQTLLEYRGKELSAMRRSLAMTRRTVVGRLLRHLREPLWFDVPHDSEPRVRENSHHDSSTDYG
jgi:hypothetical protein